MRREDRQESGRIRKAEPTPQGGLKLAAYPTRTGVLVYQNADGSVTRELRHPDEVFKAESLASMHNAPVCDGHPLGRVDGSNYRELTRGHITHEVAPADDGKHVAASLIVQDSELVKLIDDGDRKELSMGYSADIVDEAGVFEGAPFDAIQKNIAYNHVAVLPPGAGRAGPTAALRLDGKCVVLRADATMPPMKIGKEAEEPAKKKKKDAPGFDVSKFTPEELEEFEAIQAETAELQAKLGAKDAKTEGAEALAAARAALEELRAKVQAASDAGELEEEMEDRADSHYDLAYARMLDNTNCMLTPEQRATRDQQRRDAAEGKQVRRMSYADSHDAMECRLLNANRTDAQRVIR